jgi:tumor protein p53-inducible protein 3
MKAIVLRKPGGPAQLRLEEAPMPEPGDGQVVIALRTAVINE